MKKLICGILILVLSVACLSTLAENTASLDILDGSQNVTPSAEPEVSNSAPIADLQGGNNTNAVRWSYPVSLTTLESDYLVLVNAKNLLDKEYGPDTKIKMSSVKCVTVPIYLEEQAGQALELMFNAAKLVTEYPYIKQSSSGEEVEKVATYEKGMTLMLKSGWRSYGTQKTMHTNRLARNNGKDDGVVALPGGSEHQSGLCADILSETYASHPTMTQDFKWTPEAQWMKANCADFGFILRFLEEKEDLTGIIFEPWHFRYVGKESASYIMSQGMTLEEFDTEWRFALSEFIGKGGNIEEQLAYEESRLNAPPESYVLTEYGEDGDAEVSLVF